VYWRELKVWERAHELVLEIYSLRNTTREYLSFLYNARGSLEETRYYLLLSKELGYIEDGEYDRLEFLCAGISRMLNNLIKTLKH